MEDCREVLLGCDIEALADELDSDPDLQELISVTVRYNKRGDEFRVLDVHVDYRALLKAVLAKLGVAAPRPSEDDVSTARR